MRRAAYALILILAWGGGAAHGAENSLQFGLFGKVTTYSRSAKPANVVLFVSGDGGWNLGVVDMARTLASLDALVIGIDIVHYLKQVQQTSEKCLYPAGDFEVLSKYVQQQLSYPDYRTPILVGYSSGATLVYAALVQAPPGTFKGAISLGFCPDLLLTKPACPGEGLKWDQLPKGKGVSFLPASTLEQPWIAMQGLVDQVCDPTQTEAFVRQVKHGEVVQLTKVGHGFSVPKNWLPEFKAAFARIAATQPDSVPKPTVAEVSDLPLVEVPAAGSASKLMIVQLSGDGGWRLTEQGMSQTFAENGIPTVGLNSLKYFWTRRTPEGASGDLTRIMTHYLAAWKKEQIILIGYSLGADVLPFMVSRLPEELRAKIRLLVFMGLSPSVDFEFHVTDWVGLTSKSTQLPTRPEVEKLRGMRIFCFYGEEDKDILCPELDSGLVQSFLMSGGHRIRGRYSPVTEAVLNEVK